MEQPCGLWETRSGYWNILKHSLFVDFSSAGQTWTISTEVGRSIGSETGELKGEHFLALKASIEANCLMLTGRLFQRKESIYGKASQSADAPHAPLTATAL